MKIALIGCGTVGTGVAKMLLSQQQRLAAKAGRTLELCHIVVKNPGKKRESFIPASLIHSDWNKAILDPDVDIVCELLGGTTTARDVVLSALQAGKHVVTANKALLAEFGPEIFHKARECENVVSFEAAVAGGVPIIRVLAESLAANQVSSIQAILNGTSNYILSAMTENGWTYEQALGQAQQLGFAEADPSLDVDGTDAAHKLSILAQIAFGVTPRPHEIERQGIDNVQEIDIRFAQELGYCIKLLAEAWVSQMPSAEEAGKVALHVAPVMVRQTDMLASVRSAYNAIQVIGDIVGETLYQGPGAGEMPTASSVLSDIIDIAIGRAQRTFAAAQLWSTTGRGFVVEPSEKVRSRFYIRLLCQDKPGVLAGVCRILADHQISISSIIQHETPENVPHQIAPVVIMTHYAETGEFRSAQKRLATVPGVAEPVVCYPVDD